jgi:hypothetical protein
MAVLEADLATSMSPADRVALVRAQLEPIRSRVALLDSYRRESLCRLSTISIGAGSAAEVLDLAYAMRWRELEQESPIDDSGDDPMEGMVDEQPCAPWRAPADA